MEAAGGKKFGGVSLRALSVALAFGLAAPLPALAQGDLGFSPWRLEIAELAARDDVLAEFYRARDYAPLWTGEDQGPRRAALLAALDNAAAHGLPVARYDVAGLRAAMSSIRSDRDLARAEIKASTAFLRYASDLHGGAIEPSSISPMMVTKRPLPDASILLARLEAEDAGRVLRSLVPTHQAYTVLLKAKLRLEEQVARGGWGPQVPARTLRPGDSGEAVVALRDRLMRMGFLARSASAEYDARLQAAVQRFQEHHGLTPDGVAGDSTIAALNVAPEQRLRQIIVGLERQRWLNKPLGARHIMVNQASFMAYVMDDGKPTLETRVVIGQANPDWQSPEFEDRMSYMEVNPRWNIPRSIVARDYMNRLQGNPGTLTSRGYVLVDRSGRRVNPAEVDLSAYSARNMPFDLVQLPGRSNALGLVKFMFPNRFNVYLHDTPTKNLFARDKRAYSSGCIWVEKPFEFAYTLLAPQTDNPKGVFHRALDSGRETRIDIARPVPIYLTYQTAFVTPDGRLNFRDDVYGRDTRIFRALEEAGLELGDIRS